jgi:HD-GYP domain-containing protein (c-di-GMP phosphodiesterase class II)
MIEFLDAHQLNIILLLTGMCGTIIFFAIFTRTLTRARRKALIILELSAMILLNFDRIAYLYDGDASSTGYVMARISNFLIFTMTLVVIYAFNTYIIDVLTTDGGLKETPVALRVVNYIILLGIILIIISQFTGLYYTFDANNVYHRAPLFIICYILPVIAPLIQLSVILKYNSLISRGIFVSLLLFIIVPMVASFIQIFVYGFAFTDMAFIATGAILFLFALKDINDKVERANKIQIDYLRNEKENAQKLFGHMAQAFTGAIEAKETYTQGHSQRVAEYARTIAEKSGRSEDFCNEVYYAAFMHDVGKVGIPEAIVKKHDHLTPEEEASMREHPLIGGRILASISEYPYLSDGARFHHERYDGTGYPDGLKGEEIPEIARIIAVADAYDVMTSRKSYRGPLPQAIVRDEIIRNSGAQFDPEFADAMVKIIDADREYKMQNKGEEIPPKETVDCAEYRSDISDGIVVSPEITRISFKCTYDRSAAQGYSAPAIVVYDSYDGFVHTDEANIKAFGYKEYGEIWFDGHMVSTSSRNMKLTPAEGWTAPRKRTGRERFDIYEVETGRFEDHVKITVTGPEHKSEVVIALPSSSMYAYVGITGEHCSISDIKVLKTKETVRENDFSRIAQKLDFTDRLEGDLPNFQIERPRALSTEPLPVQDGLVIRFHSMTLPTSAFIWQCPYVILYTSSDGKVGGPLYHEHALLKMNGENDGNKEFSTNVWKTEKTSEFTDWKNWESKNKQGVECEVSFALKGKKIITTISDAGAIMTNTTEILEDYDEVYVIISGDQCAITDIRIKKPYL